MLALSSLTLNFQACSRLELGQTFYMYNLQGTTDSEVEVTAIYHIANRMCNNTSVPLQIYSTNPQKLMWIIIEGCNTNVPMHDQSVSGLLWDTDADQPVGY